MAPEARGPFPPASSPFPRSLPGAGRPARPRAARLSERGPLLPFLRALRQRPTPGEVASTSLFRPIGSWLARGPELSCCGTAGTPTLRVEGAGRSRTVPFQEPQPLSWGSGVGGPPGRCCPRVRA